MPTTMPVDPIATKVVEGDRSIKPTESIKVGNAAKESRSIPVADGEVEGRDDPEFCPPSAKRARVVVDTDTLRSLADRYRSHFADFSKNKKKVTQLIPNKVWTKVWADYIASNNGREQFEEKTLKSRLRSMLINQEPQESRNHGDDSTASEGEMAHNDELTIPSSVETYLESMSESFAKISSQVEKWSPEVAHERVKQGGVHDPSYIKAKKLNIQLSNLRMLADMKIITEQEMLSRVKELIQE